MTAVVDQLTFARETSALWRDTGIHVVLLPDGSTDVQVLGGGSAWLWRLLERPTTLHEIVALFDSDAAEAPTPEELAACLSLMVEQGLLRSCEQP